MKRGYAYFGTATIKQCSKVSYQRTLIHSLNVHKMETLFTILISSYNL